MGNATTVADFALYDALKWHHALDGHLVAKYGNIVEYIGKQKSPKKGCVPKLATYYSPNIKYLFKSVLFVFSYLLFFSLLQIGLKIFPK